MKAPLMQWLDETYQRRDIDLPKVGAQVRINYWIREGEKQRIQAFEGLVIRCHQRKEYLDATFTVRKLSQNFGVERTFPLHSPLIESITSKRQGRVRRAKLYYQRGRRGRRARLREVNA